MDFDLDSDNYEKEDYYDIFGLDKHMNVTKTTVETKYKDLLNNLEKEDLEDNQKTKMTKFLNDCKKNFLHY